MDTSLGADPMVNLIACKWTARTPEELSNALLKIRSLTLTQRSNLIEKAIVYAKAYFTEPDKEKMIFFLKDFDVDTIRARKKIL